MVVAAKGKKFENESQKKIEKNIHCPFYLLAEVVITIYNHVTHTK